MIETNPNLPVDEEWAATVCQFGKGEATCRYLAMGPKTWACLKSDDQVRHIITRRLPTMTAKGDNCTGRAK